MSSRAQSRRRRHPAQRPAVTPRPSYAGLVDRYAREPEWVLLPLRAFLGITFCFAGLQKLANPNFFRASSPISIQAQLRAAERTSPIHGLLSQLLHVGAFLGFVIAVAELAIGLGVLTGVLTRVAAAGGMLLSFGLFLTVSFHSRPYYTGADIGYLFAFTPLLIAGAGRHLTLPALVERLVDRLDYKYPSRVPLALVDEQLRRWLITGTLGAFGLLLAGVDAGLGRLIGGAKPPETGPQLPTASSPPRSSSAPSTTAPASGASSTSTTAPASGASTKPPGTLIGPAHDVPVGSAASFQDPASGDPAIVIQAKEGRFVAFDAVCPHAGCTVEYDSQQSILICPCHGSLFNAATGAVEQGPAASGLRPITISEGGNGQLYAD